MGPNQSKEGAKGGKRVSITKVGVSVQEKFKRKIQDKVLRNKLKKEMPKITIPKLDFPFRKVDPAA